MGSWCHCRCSTVDEESCRWCCSQLFLPASTAALNSTTCANRCTVVYALVLVVVASRIDYCNAVLYGVIDAVIRRLQAVLHAALRLITGVRRNYRITPTLRDTLYTLHWLRVSQRACNVQNCVDDIRLYPWPRHRRISVMSVYRSSLRCLLFPALFN